MTQGSPVTLSDGRTGQLAVCKGCGELDLEDIRIGEEAAGPADVADQIHRRLGKAYSAHVPSDACPALCLECEYNTANARPEGQSEEGRAAVELIERVRRKRKPNE